MVLTKHFKLINFKNAFFRRILAKRTKLFKKCAVYQLIKVTKKIKFSIFVLLTVRNGSPEVEFVQRPLLINKKTEKTFLKTFLRKILGKVSTIFEL